LVELWVKGKDLVAETVVSGFNTVDSRDLDHYRSQPGNWNVRVNQTGKGNFHSLIRSTQLPGITFYDNRWGAPCQVVGQSPDDWLMLGVNAVAGRALASWCGSRLDNRIFACTSPGKEIEFNVEQGSRSGVILIKTDLMERTCGPEALNFVLNNQHLRFDVQPGAALVEMLLGMLHYFETQPQSLQHPAIVARARSNLLLALEKCFGTLYPQEDSSPSIRDEAFHAAVLHAKQNILNTSAWDIAQAAGVSQKTLEVVFREHLGMTPGKYLTLARLNRAHYQLGKGRAGELSVTQVAADWGFTHIGRFSGAYRQLFDELPSQTLKRPAPLN
jgi:AraC-like DNA-binding protein